MKIIREFIAETLSGEVGFPPERLLGMLKVPDSSERGDLALPCFPFAKALKDKPENIARKLDERFSESEFFSSIRPEGPFLNFTYSGPVLAARILPDILDNAETYGNGTEGAGKTVVLDFSSPNIAKPIAFHHVRSTVIGAALANLHEARGYHAERINYLGDWGTQFGKLSVAFQRWGDRDLLEKEKIRHLLAIYVRFHAEAETDPGLEEEARAWFARMEKGDTEALAFWRLFYDISLAEFRRIYARLGIRFDHFEGESRYKDNLERTVERVTETAGTVESRGALVVDLESEKMPPCLLRKADGATLYATRDIAAAMDRWERFKFDRSLYVVASQQTLYFHQLFKVLEKMGFEWANRCHHVAFGMLQLADKTMSTRKGDVIFLDDVLDKAERLSLQAIEEKNPELPDKETVARQVGVGSIIFGDLINRRTNDVTFEWERILNFQGETGVYVQYTHARCCAMQRKAKTVQRELFDAQLLDRPEEKDVLKSLGRFPDRVEKAAADLDPSILAKDLIELCRAFNRVYNIEGYRFLADEPALRATRLLLARSVAIVLRRGLSLLGIEAPEEM